MCYVPRSVYTSCAHSVVEDVVECEDQQARNERWRDAGFCVSLLLSLRRCQPAGKTELKCSFCKDCSDFYRGYDCNSLDFLRRYWGFKNARSYSFCVAPSLIPPELVVSLSAAVVEDLKLPRCELIALGKAWPRAPLETPIKWLQRLEQARSVTLELAEERSLAKDRCTPWYSTEDELVCMQPRVNAPMSIYRLRPSP
ncbi:hypothetical protein VTI74DRAFT_5952 [Chaetomium olivicolor]